MDKKDLYKIFKLDFYFGIASLLITMFALFIDYFEFIGAFSLGENSLPLMAGVGAILSLFSLIFLKKTCSKIFFNLKGDPKFSFYLTITIMQIIFELVLMIILIMYVVFCYRMTFWLWLAIPKMRIVGFAISLISIFPTVMFFIFAQSFNKKLSSEKNFIFEDFNEVKNINVKINLEDHDIEIKNQEDEFKY